MAYGAVDRRVWNDERFRSWDRDTRDVWLYLLTCPHGNRLGCFVLPIYYIADDVQISPSSSREALATLEREGRIAWDPTLRVVCIRNHLHPDYNPLANPNVVKAALKDLAELPDSQKCLQALLEAVERYGHPTTEKGEPFYNMLAERLTERLERVSGTVTETVSEGLGEPTANGMGNPDPDPEQEQEPEQEEGTDPTVEADASPSGSALPEPLQGRDLSDLRELADTDPDQNGRVTKALVAAWITVQAERPSEAEIGKQGAVAKRLAQSHPPRRLALALYGMSHLFPYSQGEPWDLFDLERKISKAAEAGARAARDGPTPKDRQEGEKYRETLDAIGADP